MAVVPTIKTIQPVVIVRANDRLEDKVRWLLIGIADTLIAGWFAMLLLGALTDWGVSYWFTIGTLLLARLYQKSPSVPWLRWTYGNKE